MQKYFDDVCVIDSAGDIVPLASATVTVYNAGTTDLATIYSDNGVTPKSNPFTSETDGSFEFYAANGRYDIKVWKSPYRPNYVYDILLDDGSAVVSGSFSVALSADASLYSRLSGVDSSDLSTSTSADSSVITRLSTVDSASLSTVVSADASIVSATNSAVSSTNTQLSTVDSTTLSSTTSADTSIITRGSTADSTVTSATVSADTSLYTRLSTADSTLTAATGSLTTRDSTLTSVIGSADASVATRDSSADSTVKSALTSSDGSVVTRDNSYTDSSITSAVTRLSSADSSLVSADSSVVTQASTNASSGISAGISSCGTINTAYSTADSTVKSALVAADNSVVTRDSTADSTVKSALTSSDGSVVTQASTGASSGLSVALSAAGTISTAISTAVSTSKSTLDAADSSVVTRFSTVDSSLTAADTSVVTRFSTADSSLTSADASLAAAFATQSFANSADTSVVTRENSALLSADTSVVTQLSTVDSTNLSTALSAAASATTAGGTDSAARSMATSVATKESTDLSALTSADASVVTREGTALSTADSTVTANFTSADTSVVTRLSTVDSTNLSTAMSAAASATAAAGTDSVARSMATSVATKEGTDLSTLNSTDTSSITRFSTSTSTLTSADASLAAAFATQSFANSADTSVVTRMSTADSTNLSTAISAADSASGVGATTSYVDSADSSVVVRLSTVDSTNLSTAQSAADSAATLATGGAVDNVVRDDLVMLAWQLQVETGLGSMGLEDGFVDEFEDETGVDTTSSTNESYDSTNDHYSPAAGAVMDNMEYSSDANAQAAYVSNGATYDSYTKLLIHFNGSDGATTYTAETGQTVSFVGTAQLDTAQKQFGTASLLLDGNSDYVTVPDNADWNMGDGDFTFDAWVRFANLTGGSYYGIYGQGTDGNNWLGLDYDVSNTRWRFLIMVGGTVRVGIIYGNDATVTTGTWYHVAIVRYGNVWTIYRDGTSKGSATVAYTYPDFSGALSIGAENFVAGTQGYCDGWIDEPRVSKGIARWTTDFTKPSRAYPNTDTAGGETYTLESFSESTIKTQGSYSLKGVATTDALNKTLTRTISSPVDLSGVDTLRFDIRSSRTGSNIKIGIHDSGGTTTEITPNITSAGTFQEVEFDLSGVSDADKDDIDSIVVTIVNADSANTFYIDCFSGSLENMTLISEPVEAESEPTTGRFLALIEEVDSITINTDLKGYISNDGGSNYDQVTLAKVATYDENKDIYAGNVTLTDRSDQTMVQKIVTANGKNVKIHAWAMLWR